MNTPSKFNSDGCTMPDWLKQVMSASRYIDICKRHDFECRYSLYSWQSANWYFFKSLFKESPWYLKWQPFLYFFIVTLNWKRCAYTLGELPKRWEQYRDR